MIYKKKKGTPKLNKPKHSKHKHKPKPKPTRTNKNNWYFDNREDVCAEVWKAGERYMTLFQKKETRPRRHMQYPAMLTKYMFFLFLSGSRAMEPILSENMQLEVRSDSGNNYIYIKRVNEKHKEPNGDRQQIEVIVPIFCEYERKMWKYITNKGMEMNTKQIFQFDNWGRLNHRKLNGYISNFRVDLRDNNNSLKKQCRLTPHILRHMRAFNMLINHKAQDTFIIKIMGWNNTQMLYYYAHIRNMLTQQGMLKIARESGFLNKKFNLDAPEIAPIESAFIIPS